MADEPISLRPVVDSLLATAAAIAALEPPEDLEADTVEVILLERQRTIRTLEGCARLIRAECAPLDFRPTHTAPPPPEEND